MNWQHFRTFLWLRWRLRINQIKRGGTANAVILAILAFFAIALSFILFVSFFLIGLFALGDVSPTVLLFIWDGLVVGFLFSWFIGLITELQRSEVLSLQKFMHLPVSLSSAFLINYFSSFFSLTLLVFVPGMVGLTLGLTFSRSWTEIFVLPLIAAFVLMVTALTYQLQGWLAALMSNPRRRRTVIVFLTMFFILICQLPNLINILRPWDTETKNQYSQYSKKYKELDRMLAANEIDGQEYQKRREELLNEQNDQIKELNRRELDQVEQGARIINLVLPPGWFPWGARGIAAGEYLPAALGFLGMTLIGAGSLWRSYRATVRLYRGELGAGPKRKPLSKPLKPVQARPPRLLEAKIPGLSEQAAAIALSTFRGLLRAPETKMMLLGPILLVVIFGGIFLAQSPTVPEMVRPLMAFGAMAMSLLTMIQFVGNQFGFDRNGFRVFVLSSAPRSEILLGKNLAVAPIALAIGLSMVVLLQIFTPMRFDHFLAFLFQAVSMFLLFCIVANGMSILAPLPIPAGSFKPTSIKGIPLLMQFAFLFVFPMVMGPTLLPLAFEALSEGLGWTQGIPIYLLLSILECLAVILAYRLLLHWEGLWLQSREQKIIEVVTTKAE